MELLLRTFKEKGVRKTVPKNTMLLTEGQIEKHIYFVESGAVRAFLLTEFEELTIRFGYKNSIINSLSSFIKEMPSELYIEAIRKTNIFLLNKADLHELVYANETNLRNYTAMMELLVTQQIDREIDILTASPAERLKRVLQRSPNLFQEIPLKYIASYLRMTPETLSRIRNS